MSENSGFAMVPAWLMAAKPGAHAVLVYVHMALSGTFRPGAAEYADITVSHARLAERIGISRDSVRRGVRELETLGALTRRARFSEDGDNTSNVYRLVFGQVTQGGVQDSTGEGVQDSTGGRCRPAPQPITPTTHKKIDPENNPPTPTESARPIIKDWVDWLGTRPPGRVVGQAAKLVGEMLAEGIEADPIKIALADMSRRSLHPSVLPSLVAEQQVRAQRSGRPEMAADVTGAPGGAVVAIRPRATTTGVTNQRVTAGLELAERYRSEGR